MTTTLLEIAEEFQCPVFTEGPEDPPCGREVTRVVREPFTPGHYPIRCCDSCAKDFISSGYHADQDADRELALEKEAA